MANVVRRYEGRVAIVVGGASGLGEGFAHRFAREGASVGVLDLDPTKGHAVVEALKVQGVDAVYAEVDVTDADSTAAGVDAVVAALGGPMWPSTARASAAACTCSPSSLWPTGSRRSW